MECSELNQNYISALGAVIAALVGVILGFLLNTIKTIILKPKLRVYYDNSDNFADAMKLPLIDKKSGLQIENGWAYYFRIRIGNEGRIAAKSVEVYASFLEEKTIGGQFKRRKFIPLNLAWSHGRNIHPQNQRLIYFPSISPDMKKHCDIGHIQHPTLRTKELTSFLKIEPQEIDFQFDLIVEPSSLSHIIAKGEYHLKITVAAVNAKPIEEIIKISLSGEWFDDDKEMLTKGVVLEIV
jgi:hypothetical protein